MNDFSSLANGTYILYDTLETAECSEYGQIIDWDEWADAYNVVPDDDSDTPILVSPDQIIEIVETVTK